MATKKEPLSELFSLHNLSYMQDNYIYWIQKYDHHWFMINTFPKKLPSLEYFTTQTFLEQSAVLSES